VVIDDASISAKHAKLIVTPESMRIIDLDSKNGIKMNSSGNTLAKNT
jgi:pSer/pThr/pTyr-binding forkhead associated (FHA) protein